MKLNYKIVNPTDIDEVGFLYLLLSERRKEENISHFEMPTFSQHTEFVKKNNYRWWFIIEIENEPYSVCRIGSAYITDKNYIGIHLLQAFQRQRLGPEILKYITNIDDGYTDPFYANINPANEKSIKLFERAGFRHIQNTYKLECFKGN